MYNFHRCLDVCDCSARKGEPGSSATNVNQVFASGGSASAGNGNAACGPGAIVGIKADTVSIHQYHNK